WAGVRSKGCAMTRKLCLALLAFILLLPADAIAQVKSFSHSGIARDAERYETAIRANAAAGAVKTRALIEAGRRALGASDPRLATRAFAQAAAAAPQDAEAWILLAHALLDTTPDPNRPAERYDLPANASAAAYIGYRRASAGDLQANALALLGESLKRRSIWRPAIEAFKASLALEDVPQVREVYEALRSEHGFRLVDYSVEQDLAVPRVCLQFSENLQRGQDFSQYVAVDGQDAQALVPEGKQLCIEGLSHGRRYQVLVRAGLPSEVAE